MHYPVYDIKRFIDNNNNCKTCSNVAAAIICKYDSDARDVSSAAYYRYLHTIESETTSINSCGADGSVSKVFDISERVQSVCRRGKPVPGKSIYYHSRYLSAPNFISFRERVPTYPKTSPIVVIFVECLSQDFETLTFF